MIIYGLLKKDRSKEQCISFLRLTIDGPRIFCGEKQTCQNTSAHSFSNLLKVAGLNVVANLKLLKT